MATQDYADQLTAIYLQLSQINKVLASLSSLSDVNTIQNTLQGQLTTLYSQIGSLQQTVQQMDLAVSAILCELRSN